MRKCLIVIVLVGLLIPTAVQAGRCPTSLHPALCGSGAAVNRALQMAKKHDFTRVKDVEQLTKFVKLQLLVPVQPNGDFHLSGVSHPVARPALRLLIHRLTHQSRAHCKSKLVVTSLTRPLSRRLRNGSAETVHPAGIAVDFRIVSETRCRKWLEGLLVRMETDARVIEATREYHPPHYHVVVDSSRYFDYVERLEIGKTYTVRTGDTLSEIAEQHGLTTAELKKKNRLTNNSIRTGQILVIR